MRPSELIGIRDPLAAINFDVAALVQGRRSEKEASKSSASDPFAGKQMASRADWMALLSKSKKR